MYLIVRKLNYIINSNSVLSEKTLFKIYNVLLKNKYRFDCEV